MTISEKIVHTHPNELRLYKEGVFWVAYEQSAYIISQIKELKPTKKMVKKLGQEIVSVGFPNSVLDKVIAEFELIERNENQIALRWKHSCDELAYNGWKNNIEIAMPNKASMPVAQIRDYSATDRLLAFDIGNSTPIQCVMFLNDLQQSIIKSNGTLRESTSI